jgi:peptidoglycan hydrolase CwlO-like protein
MLANQYMVTQVKPKLRGDQLYISGHSFETDNSSKVQTLKAQITKLREEVEKTKDELEKTKTEFAKTKGELAQCHEHIWQQQLQLKQCQSGQRTPTGLSPGSALI